MDAAPNVFPPKFAEKMKQEAEEFLKEVMQAVNQASDGDWIADSEERVRNLTAEFRKRVYERALQERIDAAEAAFSPSGDNRDRSGLSAAGAEAESQQGAAEDLAVDDQRPD
jgi:hypothetical protein